MAYLWCLDCGKKRQDSFENSTMHDGESVVTNKGPVIGSDNYICDRCNKTIEIREVAVLCEFLPSGYQPSTELLESYFDVNNISQKTYK